MLDNVNKYSTKDILKAIHEAGSDSLVYVGTDSKQTKTQTVFITVVIIHYGAKSSEGGKGCKVFPFVTSSKRIKELRHRLMQEVYTAMGYALELAYGVDEIPGIPADMIEVHMDINPNPKHKSSVAVKEAVAYVMGQGMTPKVKPDALAATGTSDWIGRRPNLKFEAVG